MTTKCAPFRRWVVRIVKVGEMNARKKLKTCDLMGINTHIVYHAYRINTEWGWGLFKKQTVVGVVRVVAIRFNSKGGGGVSLKYRR